MRRWQFERYSTAMNRNKDCEDELAALLRDPIPENDVELEAFVMKKREFDTELKHLKLIEDQCWQQKSRVQCLREGDRNTFFFHRVVSGCRHGNLITPAMASLLDDVSVNILNTVVTEALKERFNPSLCLHILEWETSFTSLDISQAMSLEIHFLEEEILKSLKEVDGHKVPGPNGFPFKFAQSFWEVFKGDLMGLFKKFFVDAEFDHRFSESFITLIPKVKSRSSLNEFRPISLHGWIHKLAAKVLTLKLRSIIDCLISHTQTTFIRWRSIYDG